MPTNTEGQNQPSENMNTSSSDTSLEGTRLVASSSSNNNKQEEHKIGSGAGLESANTERKKDDALILDDGQPGSSSSLFTSRKVSLFSSLNSIDDEDSPLRLSQLFPSKEESTPATETSSMLASNQTQPSTGEQQPIGPTRSERKTSPSKPPMISTNSKKDLTPLIVAPSSSTQQTSNDNQQPTTSSVPQQPLQPNNQTPTIDDMSSLTITVPSEYDKVLQSNNPIQQQPSPQTLNLAHKSISNLSGVPSSPPISPTVLYYSNLSDFA